MPGKYENVMYIISNYHESKTGKVFNGPLKPCASTKIDQTHLDISISFNAISLSMQQIYKITLFCQLCVSFLIEISGFLDFLLFFPTVCGWMCRESRSEDHVVHLYCLCMSVCSTCSWCQAMWNGWDDGWRWLATTCHVRTQHSYTLHYSEEGVGYQGGYLDVTQFRRARGQLPLPVKIE